LVSIGHGSGACPGTTSVTRFVELEPTEDILAEAAQECRSLTDGTDPQGRTPRQRLGRPILVGFAAETGRLDRAPEKASRKGVDLLVANDVTEPGSGFGSSTNRVTLVVPGQAPEPWPMLTKAQVAERLIDRLLAVHRAAGASSSDSPPERGPREQSP
jgi:phosphopantothenoylcysteine synthetase/decarboxylase